MDYLRLKINSSTGFDIVRASHQLTLRTHLMAVLGNYKVDTVLDVGANGGQFGRSLREIGFKGDIHSFEPVKEAYGSLLRVSSKDRRWLAHNVALGDKSGKGVINVSRGSTLSSFLRANEYGQNWKWMEVSHQEEIEITTVDNFLDQLHAREKSLSRSSLVTGFVVSAASPAARKASRHSVKVAAVTPSERDRSSRSSPPSNRNTAVTLRCRDILPPRPGAAAPDSCGRSASPDAFQP
jgi:FkbM family methyltransferase